MPALLTEPVPHHEAAAFVRNLPATSRDIFATLLPELRAYAFCISGIEKMDVVQEARDLIATIPEGADWDAVKGELIEKITPYFSDRDAAERRAELLLRMHTGRAYAAAAYRTQLADRELFPYVMWQSMGDDRVRPAHAALDGKVFPLDSPFIQRHYPPDGFGCRCQAIPMSEYDVQELREADADLPPEQRRVLEGAALRDIETNERIPDPSGNGQMVSLIESENDPAWTPGLLQMPLDKLRQKYDPDIWHAFEEAAKQTPIEPGKPRTVWEWMNQLLPPSGPTPPPTPTPTPTPPTVPPSTPAGTPIAPHLDIKPRRGPVRKAARESLDLINSVHGDGDLKLTPLRQDSRLDAAGAYIRKSSPARQLLDPLDFTSEIRINPKGDHLHLTLLHEIGHKIDFEAVQYNRNLNVREAAHALMDALNSSTRASQIRQSDQFSFYYKVYLLSDVELWARSYAQFIAQATGDELLMKQLRSILDDPKYGVTQWPEDEFTNHILPRWQRLLAALGWLTLPNTPTP